MKFCGNFIKPSFCQEPPQYLPLLHAIDQARLTFSHSKCREHHKIIFSYIFTKRPDNFVKSMMYEKNVFGCFLFFVLFQFQYQVAYTFQNCSSFFRCKFCYKNIISCEKKNIWSYFSVFLHLMYCWHFQLF